MEVHPANPSVDQQQLHFNDGDAGFSLDFNAPMSNGFSRSQMPDMEIKNFLSRPVKIFTYDWAQSTQARATFAPWELYLTDPIIKKN